MRLLLISTTILSLAAGAVFADPAPATPEKPAAAASATAAKDDFIPKEKWDKMTPEQKKKIKEERFEKRRAERAEWKKKFDAASPAEKDKMKADLEAKHAENKAKWKARYDKASPEEKKQMDERMEHRKERRQEWLKEHGKDGTPSTPAK